MKLVKESSEDIAANQMSLLSDTDEVVKFLEFVGEKSILNESTVTCRMTACKHLFSILNEDEDSIEYILENLDLLVNRFRNRHTAVQPNTLKVYKSRVKSSLEDYRAWSKDPIAWEKSLHEKTKAVLKEKKSRAQTVKSQRRKNYAPETIDSVSTPLAPTANNGLRRVSFPIRPDFNLEVTLPGEGLSMKELLRLGLFLYPYCKDLESREEQSAWAAALSFAKN